MYRINILFVLNYTKKFKYLDVKKHRRRLTVHSVQSFPKTIICELCYYNIISHATYSWWSWTLFINNVYTRQSHTFGNSFRSSSVTYLLSREVSKCTKKSIATMSRGLTNYNIKIGCSLITLSTIFDMHDLNGW